MAKPSNHAFNNKNLAGSCQLFSKSVVADCQGVSQKNYHAICHGLKRIFAEKSTRYYYRFKLHHVYRSHDLAVVRITWYLSDYKNKKRISVVQDEGLDVFKRNSHGRWQIVNYLGFPVKTM